jgi:hypothetical protein
VIFIDMPYGREEAPGGRSGEKRPPWWNPDEASAALRALELLRAREGDGRPSLAVLSPYWQQVKKLSQGISRNLDGTLAHLGKFAPAIEQNEYCGTVDSFQGGEADIVIVSLVRNNSHATPAKPIHKGHYQVSLYAPTGAAQKDAGCFRSIAKVGVLVGRAGRGILRASARTRHHGSNEGSSGARSTTNGPATT